MSVCKVDKGKKTKHKYLDNDNQCVYCGHVTTHGTNFRKAEAKKAKENQ